MQTAKKYQKEKMYKTKKKGKVEVSSPFIPAGENNFNSFSPSVNIM